MTDEHDGSPSPGGAAAPGAQPPPVVRTRVRAPGAEVPDADVPDTDVPDTDVPDTDVPGADVPGADVPGADVPGADVAGTELAGVQGRAPGRAADGLPGIPPAATAESEGQDPAITGVDPATSAESAAPGDDWVGGRDGGVTRRLSRRCGVGAAILIGVAVICLLAVGLLEWTVLSAGLAIVAVAAVLGGFAMGRRWALWSAVARAEVPAGLGFTATTGDPRALTPRSTGPPIKRRFGAMVLPIRADSEATPGDGAVIVHARADGAVPAAGDRLRVVLIAGRREPLGAGIERRTAVRVLMLRDSDGAMFVATTRVTDTW